MGSRTNRKPDERSVLLDRRAQWMMRTWNNRPSLRYPQLIELTRKRFGIGVGAAERVHARAKELYAEQLKNLDISRLLAHYWDIYEGAVFDRKWNSAARILDSMALVTGKAAPGRVHVTGQLGVEHVAHVAVLQLTPIERAARERELAARESLPALDVPDPQAVAIADDSTAE